MLDFRELCHGGEAGQATEHGLGNDLRFGAPGSGETSPPTISPQRCYSPPKSTIGRVMLTAYSAARYLLYFIVEIETDRFSALIHCRMLIVSRQLSPGRSLTRPPLLPPASCLEPSTA